ncbi:MAG TPA: beta-ketoacyl synthase N-terminal-like domain-containing protein [Thermoanaerobaculia bacterium]|nr:beta-ketoacyl synthase N-terminal-like domain-containing protein [Thermoanaerobaculia bacterium]
MRRVGVFGWGIVGPKSPNIDRFRENLESADSWLSPFNGFGPNNFLVGMPEFRFEDYKSWIDARFRPNRYPQLAEKMDPTTLFAIGSFIQALGQNPGIEDELKRLRTAAHVYIGTGLGNVPTIERISLDVHRAQRNWNRYWADPVRNPPLASFLSGDTRGHEDAPPHPEQAPPDERDQAEERWWAYWGSRSPELARYVSELAEIEGLVVEGNVEAGKISMIKEKQRRHARLKARWQSPDPPWKAASPNLLWNISNTPASQISMLGQITGVVFAPVAACSTFGVALKLALDAIDRGEAKAVVMGASDPPPHPLSVGAFYNARVMAANGDVSKPLSGLRGTHVAGGSAVWIVGDLDYFTARGYRPLGMEPIAVGVTADADHIITPSKEGPIAAVRLALAKSGASPAELGSWDLHATATPGDYLEVENLRDLLPESVLVTARKGTFGHGMSAAGGWELTAQYLGYQSGRLFPTPLAEEELNAEIARVHRNFVFNRGCPTPPGLAGKLSMGVGGVNACVISRPLRTASSV